MSERRLPLKAPKLNKLFVGEACPDALQNSASTGWSSPRFFPSRQIGGTSAPVFAVMDLLTGEKCALKVYECTADAGATAALRQELLVDAMIHHPNILPTYAVFEENQKVYVVNRLARTDDNLRRLMPEIEWGEAEIAEHIAAPLTSALATLHLLGVHHRDIRPENILLSGTHATLCGFDRAKHPSPDDVPCASTLPYTAPEVLSAMLSDNPTPAPDAAALGPKADVYALGGVIYECLKHTPPFRGGTREEVVADMLRDESPCLSGLSVPAKDFLKHCFVRDPVERPSALSLFRHPWIRMHVSEQQWDRLNPERWVHATMRAAERAQEKGRPSSDATPAQADAAREERDESQKGISEEQDEGEEDGDRKDALKRRDGGQKDTEQVDDAEDDAGLFLEERGDPRPLNTAKGSGAQDVAEERPAATTGTHGARGDAERERPRLHAVDESGRGGSGGRHGQNVTENAAEHSLTRHLLDSKPESKLSTKLTNVPVGWERVGDAKGKDSEKAVVGKTTLSPGQLSKTGAWLTQKGSQQRHTIHGEYQGTWQAEDEGKKGRRQKRGTYTAGSMEVPTGWWRRSKAQAGTGTAEVSQSSTARRSSAFRWVAQLFRRRSRVAPESSAG